MTLAAAQRLLTDLIAAGYDAYATQLAAGDWRVGTSAPVFVDKPTALAFAGQHLVDVVSYGVTTSVQFD